MFFVFFELLGAAAAGARARTAAGTAMKSDYRETVRGAGFLPVQFMEVGHAKPPSTAGLDARVQ